MRRRISAVRCSVRIALALASSIAGFSQEIAVDLDPDRTQIAFVLGDVLHTVRGTFRMKTGRVAIDLNQKTVSGQIVVDPASAESGNGVRDRRMKKDILETTRYPDVTFTPTKVDDVKLGPETSSVTVIGWFAIHGARHEISVPMQIKMNGTSVTANGKFAVPYVAWGMKNPSTFILRVNDTVEVDVSAVGRIASSNP